MENVVTINNTKENVLEFDISVQGLDTEDIRVWFCVSANGMDIGFPCEREGSGDKWISKIPPLPFIDRTAYPCSVKIVADGYYFEPLNGTLNVVGSTEIYSTTPKNTSVQPPKENNVVIQTEAKRSLPKKHGEKSIAQIAEELMEKAKLDENLDEKVAKRKEDKAKDKTKPKKKDADVKAILEDLGVKPKGAKNTPRVTFVKKD